MHDAPDAVAAALMDAFARRTGLTSDQPPRRYLWTDAFAVCTFLTLHHRTGSERWLDLALQLVDQVHHVLGRHRGDDSRTGWISGLGDEEGERHPTRGGLRIGKERGERDADEPYDPQREWDRDGQYFHYLTKWTHALHRIGDVTGEADYQRWAVELAHAAHAAFAFLPASGGAPRMYWKMSIDLSRPLVDSMGQHDPLDGLLTYLELQAAHPETRFDAEVAEAVHICRGQYWATDDPLGLGGLLTDTFRAARLTASTFPELDDLLQRLLHDARRGLSSYVKPAPLGRSAHHRLAFRELGLAIGLHATKHLHGLVVADAASFDEAVPRLVEDLLPFAELAETIEAFWLEEEHQQVDSWTARHDINAVMLATSLAPDAYLSA